ncbi:MAG: 16S rRNA (guanine(966)-N(2))-methyltransferase RsmD [Eubacterium sp.]
MRVIAGKARHLHLKTVKGMETRPTTDRIKETLFNILQYDIPGCIFLDLFSGSGAIGIEALSRGADKCYFVENSKSAQECIKYNLEFTRLKDAAVIIKTDVLTAIKQISCQNIIFDFIFMDPPYNKEIEKDVLKELAVSGLIDEYTTIIVEASLNTNFDYLQDMGYKLLRKKDYKTNSHVFISKI